MPIARTVCLDRQPCSRSADHAAGIKAILEIIAPSLSVVRTVLMKLVGSRAVAGRQRQRSSRTELLAPGAAADGGPTCHARDRGHDVVLGDRLALSPSPPTDRSPTAGQSGPARRTPPCRAGSPSPPIKHVEDYRQHRAVRARCHRDRRLDPGRLGHPPTIAAQPENRTSLGPHPRTPGGYILVGSAWLMSGGLDSRDLPYTSGSSGTVR